MLQLNSTKNNFDFLRLLFSIFVVITHSYFFTGFGEKDLLNNLTDGQTTFSYLGVRGFFVISGYLIFQSMQRSSSFQSYLWKRFLRLFPALFIALLLTVCLGFFVYDGSFLKYINNRAVWTYLPCNLSLYNLQYGITGVFDGDTINGSIWTIRYEFSFYIILSLFFLFRKKQKFTTVFLLCLFCILFLGKFYFFEKIGSFGIRFCNSISLNLGLFFIAGSLLASLKIEQMKFRFVVGFISIILLVFSFYHHYFFFSQFLLLPLMVILFGISTTKFVHSISHSIGDISYGIYIYSFPIQRTLVYYFEFNFFTLMIVSLLLSIIFGFLSWNIIEKWVLKFKSSSMANFFIKTKPIMTI